MTKLHEGKTAYCAARILPSANAQPWHDAAVLVESGAIVAITGRSDIPAGYGEVDLGQQWLLPGLIDAHVHLVWDGSASPDETLRSESAQMSVLRAAHHAHAHLLNGVTTVRDLGAPYPTVLAVRDAINTGIAAGARVIAAGNIIGRTPSEDILRTVAANAEQVRRIVGELLTAGVDVIKLLATGGVFGESEELDEFDLGRAELAEAVAIAHHSGRKVAVHAYSPGGIRNAIAAEADTIEHASFLDAETAQAAAAGGQIVVPTLLAYRRYVELGTEAGLPARSVEKAARAVTAGRIAMSHAMEHGVAIAAGTDGGGRCKPHGWLYREIAYLVECGMRPDDALAAATTVAARACGLTDAGELSVGCRADIIGVDANPTDDISTLAGIRTVIAAGRLVKATTMPEGASWSGGMSS